MNPGTSLRTRIGTDPQRFMNALSESAAARSVASPSTTSTKGTRWAGMKKCNPIMRSCVGKPCAIWLIGKLELLLVSKAWAGRSEEHTSELQSLMRISYAVFCLKKKKKKKEYSI